MSVEIPTTATIVIDGVTFGVGPAPRLDGRRHWRYVIARGDEALASGTDLTTVGDDAEEALTALLGFLSAWLEAPDGDLAGMFPDTCRDLDGDEISIVAVERKETTDG
jgi:hypothetical protein